MILRRNRGQTDLVSNGAVSYVRSHMHIDGLEDHSEASELARKGDATSKIVPVESRPRKSEGG
jgi:hypothetical protein